MSPTKAQKEHALLEAVAAITGEFFFDNDGYQKFYDRHCDDIGGITGVWAELIKASKIFEEVSKQFGMPGENYDWLCAVQDYAKLLHGTEQLTPGTYVHLSSEALRHNKYKKGGKSGR